MGTILGRQIIERAHKILGDEGVRWTIDEMSWWLNGGQRQIVLLRPDAYSRTQSLQCVAGTLQRIPTASLRLLKVTRAMGTDNVAVRAIRYVEMAILDAESPN